MITKRNLSLPTGILILLMLCCTAVLAQKKISMEDVFKNGAFSQKTISGINWMNDGRYYSTLITDGNGPKVVKMNISTGQQEAILVDGAKLEINFTEYAFNQEETKALIGSQKESIYRRSSKGVFHVVDLNSGNSQVLMNGEKISYATLSPDNLKVAFVQNNDLYFTDLASNQVTRVTYDGEFNKIINGAADWVYEEEFSMAQAFSWSPDGKKLAFIRFDETEVPVYNMQVWRGLYPEDYRFKYPKAGEKNSEVSIHVFDLLGKKTVQIETGSEKDIYLPRIYWTGDAGTLAFIKLNRLQNQMDLYYANTNSGRSRLVLAEKSETYVDLDYNDNLHFLEGNKGFIRTSEQDGFKHIYHHDQQGKLISQVTSGNWEVTELVGVDENKKDIYFISTEVSTLDRNLFVINFNGRGKKNLTSQPGTHRINMSPDFKYFIDNHSTANTPLEVTLKESDGKLVKVLENNRELKERVSRMAFSPKEFFEFKTQSNVSLNAYMIKPPQFDAGKKYPVLMYVYGGPGSQNVTNSWGSLRDFWHQHLASEGYIVVCVDNRGTGGKGRDFKHGTYANLGKLETEDQMAGARHLATLPFVDSKRIGIWGWSYGGYMSSLALMLGHDLFKTAIAVAPVTNWRFYDTIYTERYLKTPQLNPSGYDDYSPITHVNKLKGNYLLIHGTGDDNVHFQNSVDLVDALIRADKQFETFYYPNRNHGIYGGNTTWHLYHMMTDYIKRNL